MNKKQDQLEYLRCSKLGWCTRCKLADAGRSKIVFGSGNPDANLMLIGEAPGQFEDVLGQPFVGDSGKLLNKLLKHGGTSREDVYVANVVKCRPPDNRDPHPDEIEKCLPYLHAQIGLVRPAAIVTLGRFAANAVTGHSTPLEMNVLQSRTWSYRNAKSGVHVPVICIYHPGYLWRQLRPEGGRIASSGKDLYNAAVRQMKKAVQLAEPLELDL